MTEIEFQLPALTLEHYAAQAGKSDRFASDANGLQKIRYGYFGEIGGLLAALKKVSRDQLFESEMQFAAEELGDALWYLFALARLQRIAPGRIGEICLLNLRQRFGEAAKSHADAITFRQIDGIVSAQGRENLLDQEMLLGNLAESAGILAQGDSKQRRIHQESSLAAQLAFLLALLGMTAAAFRISLESVARKNLVKIHDRWPGDEQTYIPLFDDLPKYPPYERFERQFAVRFEERTKEGKPHVVQSINGVYIGDRLTDNSVQPDGYRFHDVFHLAYVAHLGWSPVIRGLLKRKRKSDPDVDENQDGARAMIIEEGIATWIFNHAKSRKYYEGVEEGKLDYSLLKQVRSMVEGYEVDACPLWQWERAILAGFRVFRDIRERGGIIHIDMSAHSIEFRALEEGA